MKKDINDDDIDKIISSIKLANRTLLLSFLLYLSFGYPVRRINNVSNYHKRLKESHEALFNEKAKRISNSTGEKYIDIFLEYEDLVDNTANFYINELGINNPVEAFVCYTGMVKLGYFSFDIGTHRNVTPENEIISNFGISMLQGTGVCRHNASNLTNIFKSMGYEAYTIACQMQESKDKMIDTVKFNSYMYREKETVFDIDITLDTKERANHAVTLVNYLDKFYIFDPTNNCIYVNESGKYKYISVLEEKEKDLDIFITSFITSFLVGFIDEVELFDLSIKFDNDKTIKESDIDKDKIKEYCEKYYLIPDSLYYNIYDDFYNKEVNDIIQINKIIKKTKLSN